MNKSDWIKEIEAKHKTCGPVECETYALLSALNKALEALEEIGKVARENEIRDNKDLMAAPKGNPNNCWAQFSRHTQDLGWIADTAQEAINFNPQEASK